MSQIEKLKKRLLSKPKDFTMEELERLLLKLGCMKKDQGKTSGSRVAFTDPATGITLKLHDPHPQKHLKSYAINLAIEFLREIGRL